MSSDFTPGTDVKIEYSTRVSWNFCGKRPVEIQS
jgi:hypothetical protein